MAVNKRKTAFSVTTIVTMIAGFLVLVACVLPLYDRHEDRTRAMRVSIELATYINQRDPATALPLVDDEEVGRMLQQRVAVQGVEWIGATELASLEESEPLRDIAHQFNLDLQPTKITPDFTTVFLQRADEAAANPTVWNLYWLTRLTGEFPAIFTPKAQARGSLVATILMLLPALGLICLATPLLSRFETGSVMTPIYQAFGFAGLIAAIAIAFVVIKPTDYAPAFGIGVPAITVGFGSLILYFSVVVLGASVVFGLAHRFWWMSLALYLGVLILSAVLYFFTVGSVSSDTPETATLPGAPRMPVAVGTVTPARL